MIQHLRVVPIFWQPPGGGVDPDQANIVEFDTWLLGGQQWLDMVGEYDDSSGNYVGAGTVTAPIVVGPAPATLTDQDLATLVDTGTSTGGWPTPDTSTLYVFYPDPSTTLTQGTWTVCSPSGAGFHGTSKKGSYYAAVTRCPNGTHLAQATIVSTFTFGGMTTNTTGNGWTFSPFDLGLDDGNLCEPLNATPDGTHVVGRLFSNKENDLGHDPCLPVPSGEVYANVLMSPVALNVSASTGPAIMTLTPFTDGTVQGPLTVTFYPDPAGSLTFAGPSTINIGDTNVPYNVSAAAPSGTISVMVDVKQANGTETRAHAAARIGQ
jgi:hypothetical protein